MAAFSSGCSRPVRLASTTLAENVSSVSLYSSPRLKMVKKPLGVPLRCLFHFLLFPSHYPFTSPSLFIHFAAVLPPIYPTLLLTCLTAEEGEGGEDRLRFCCHVMLMVSRSGSILHPGDGPSRPSP